MRVTGTVGPVEHCFNADQCVVLSLKPPFVDQRQVLLLLL